MKTRSRSLIVSTAILCAFGVLTLYRLVTSLVLRGHGPLADVPPPTMTIVSDILAALFWCGLALVHWVRDGAWGRGVGIFAVVVLVIQSCLIYLAVTRGGIPLTTSVVTNFFFTALGDLALSASTFISYADYQRKKSLTSRQSQRRGCAPPRLICDVGQRMKALLTVSIGCFVVFAACARVDVPVFTSVECSADPIGPPVTDPRKIQDLSKILRTLPGNWTKVSSQPPKTGLAAVLKRDSHAVAQIVVGKNWLSMQAVDDRGPLANSALYEKYITLSDYERIIHLAKERPNQALEPTATSVTSPAAQEPRQP